MGFRNHIAWYESLSFTSGSQDELARKLSSASGSQVCSSGYQSPRRGRRSKQKSIGGSGIRRSSTRVRRTTISPRLDTEFLYHRLLTETFTSEPHSPISAVSQDSIKSFQIAWRYSLSEELYRASTFELTNDLNNFRAHRDTFALLGIQRSQSWAIELPVNFYLRLASIIDFDTFKAIRLTCRVWSSAITHARPLKTPCVTKLPFEVLDLVYSYLNTRSFESARHTCRAWMIASLNVPRLLDHLRMLGCSAAVALDLKLQNAWNDQETSGNMSEDWLLSKRLTTEASLLGLKTIDSANTGQTGEIESQTTDAILSLTSITDFRSVRNSEVTGACSQKFEFEIQFSVCQHFLLGTVGSVVHVFALYSTDDNIHHPFGGALRLVTSIHCHSNVVDASMDSSLDQYKVAILHEDGTVIIRSLHESCTDRESLRASIAQTPSDSPTHHSLENAIRIELDRVISAKICAEQFLNLHTITIAPEGRRVAVDFESSEGGKGIMVLEPLKSTKDCVCRIISADCSIRQRPCFLPCSDDRERFEYGASITNLVNECEPVLSTDSSIIIHRGRMYDPAECQSSKSLPILPRQCNVRPIRNSSFTLFTDGFRGQLCLGEHSLVDGEPHTQISYDVMCEGPEGRFPICYAAGQEAGWGLRVVAAYSDALWLFVVPADLGFKTPEMLQKFGPRPVSISGTRIASLSQICGVSVDADVGDLTIRACTKAGQLYTWQLASMHDRQLLHRRILDDGSIFECTDDADTLSLLDASDVTPICFDSQQPSPRENNSLGEAYTRGLDTEGDTIMGGYDGVAEFAHKFEVAHWQGEVCAA